MIKRFGINYVVLLFLMLEAVGVRAQSSVTLYGIIDTSISYQSSATKLGTNSGGRSNVFMSSGVWSGSRFGFRGVEDLGGQTHVVFQLENGFSSNTGAAQQGGLLFGRLAYVGFDNPAYGSLTFGRQYTSYFSMLIPYAPTRWLAMHPGDLDAMDYTFHTNNSIVYTSPNLRGFTFSGSYALAGIPGSVNQGSTWSVGVRYQGGPVGGAIGFSRINNATPGGGAFSSSSTTWSGSQTGVSSLTNGYQTAQAQQRFAAIGSYNFSNAWDVSVTYSNVQYIPGSGSKFVDPAIFNTIGVLVHWKPAVMLDLASGYSYTRATTANGISHAASYHQFNLTEYYALSKRTGLYAFEAYERANGQTLGTNGVGDVIEATPTIADNFQSSPSSSRSQVGLVVGMIHRF